MRSCALGPLTDSHAAATLVGQNGALQYLFRESGRVTLTLTRPFADPRLRAHTDPHFHPHPNLGGADSFLKETREAERSGTAGWLRAPEKSQPPRRRPHRRSKQSATGPADASAAREQGATAEDATMKTAPPASLNA